MLSYATLKQNDFKIVVDDLDSGEQEVLTVCSMPAYSPSGHVVDQAGHRDEEVWAVPFSLSSLKPVGDAFRIGAKRTDVSVSANGSMVHVSSRIEQQLVWLDRTGRHLTAVGRPQLEVQYPSVFPDGRYIAVKGIEEGIGESDIWILERNGATRTRLTNHPSQDTRLVWSSSNEVAFSSMRTGNYDNAIPPDAKPGHRGHQSWQPHGDYFLPKNSGQIAGLQRAQRVRSHYRRRADQVHVQDQREGE